MIKVGLISDTHSFFDKRFYELFKDVDEIWHAGDIGSDNVLDEMESFKTTRAVFGNIDNTSIRRRTTEELLFTCENIKVMMTHIGGYPGKYNKQLKTRLINTKPDIFICGHSHILKIIYDKEYNLLHINPGACGKYGFHSIRTAVRFIIDGDKIKDMNVIELDNRSRLV